MSLRSEVSTYFGKTVSGFVANKFIVEITGMNMPLLRFYVKKVSIPYENMNTVEDIYVSDVTLARPRNVVAVQTPVEASFTFRMDPDNLIIRQLEMLFSSTHNSDTFEVSRKPVKFDISIKLYGTDHIEKYSKTLTNCTLIKMETYDLDASDRKLKEYNVTFLCNKIDDSNYYNKSGGTVLEKVNCQSLKDAYEIAKRKYKDKLNAQLAGEITPAVMDDALNVSNIIPVYLRMITNAAQCRWDEIFQIGVDIPAPTRVYLYDKLIKAGVPSDHIRNGNA